MKYIALILPLLFLGSCVTSGDLFRVEQKIDSVVADGVVTEQEADELKTTIEAVAADVEDRTTNSLEALAGTGGLTGLLTAFGLNAYRNAQRRKRHEPVAVPDQPAS